MNYSKVIGDGLLLYFVVLPLLAQQAPQPALLSGALRSPAGLPLGGAQVGILKKAPASVKSGFPVPTGGIAARTVTGPNGLFQIPAKFAGEHILCIQPADYIHLDPCLWGTPQQLTLTAEQDRGFGAITLPRGVELRVVVEDPDGLLGLPESVGYNGILMVGYQAAAGIFTPMRLQSVSANGSGNNIQYAVAIPPNVDIQVVLLTHKVKVTDEKAAILRAGGASPIAVRATPVETLRTLRFRVGKL